MKNLLQKSLLICAAFFCLSNNAFTAGEKPVATTAHFDFYNNYWVNLHHFLYDKALKEAPELTTDSLENQIVLKLNENDRRAYDQAVDFYRKYLASRSLVSDKIMHTIHACLVNFDAKTTPNCTDLEQEHIEIFKSFSPVYKKHFWKLHSEQNMGKLNEHLNTLQLVGNDIVQQITSLSNTAWQDVKIRVDLSTHASRSGSYFLLNPMMITISTASKRLQGTLFIEMLFHEASHSIMSADKGAISQNIAKASQALGKQPPFDFWHMVLFYIVGESTKTALAKQNIEHQTYMETYNVAKRYNAILADNMEIYIDGKISLFEALRRTIDKAQN